MIVRTLDEITDTDRDVKTPNWRSKRIVLGGDRVGFSVHETVLEPGTVNDFWYATPAPSAKALIDEESHMRSASLGHYSDWDSCAGGKQMSLKCKRLDDI